MVIWATVHHWASDAIAFLLRVGAPLFGRRRSEPREVNRNDQSETLESTEIRETSQTIVRVERVLIVKTKKTYGDNNRG